MSCADANSSVYPKCAANGNIGRCNVEDDLSVIVRAQAHERGEMLSDTEVSNYSYFSLSLFADSEHDVHSFKFFSLRGFCSLIAILYGAFVH